MGEKISMNDNKIETDITRKCINKETELKCSFITVSSSVALGKKSSLQIAFHVI